MTQKDIRSIFGSFPVKFPPIKFFREIFIAPKDSSLNFRGSLLSYFWAIMLISAVMSIFEDFGNLLQAHSVAVKIKNFKLASFSQNGQKIRPESHTGPPFFGPNHLTADRTGKSETFG